jgi:hypothetical protein
VPSDNPANPENPNQVPLSYVKRGGTDPHIYIAGYRPGFPRR